MEGLTGSSEADCLGEHSLIAPLRGSNWRRGGRTAGRGQMFGVGPFGKVMDWVFSNVQITVQCAVLYLRIIT